MNYIVVVHRQVVIHTNGRSHERYIATQHNSGHQVLHNEALRTTLLVASLQQGLVRSWQRPSSIQYLGSIESHYKHLRCCSSSDMLRLPQSLSMTPGCIKY